MLRTKIILTVSFMLAMGAGLAAGTLFSRLPAKALTTARTPLGAELRLTPEQNARMQDIWEEVRNRVDACFVRAQEAQKRRESALVGILTEEQKSKFEPAQHQYTSTLEGIKSERDAVFRLRFSRTDRGTDSDDAD